MMHLLEIKAYDPVAAAEKTLYFADRAVVPFAASDADRPNQFYSPRIHEVGIYRRAMFGSGRTSGKSASNAGTIILVNADGGLDYLEDWGISGREIKLYEGQAGQAFNQFNLVLSASARQPVFNYSSSQPSTVELTLLDKQALFDQPIQTNLYLGTNSGSTGNEGLADDIKDTPKPLGFGQCFNVTAVPVNAAGLRYQVHDGQISSIDAVYDNGVAITYNASPAAGEYSHDLTTGIITLGATPAGTVTVDFKGHAQGGYVSSVADIVERIVSDYAGLGAGEIHSQSITDLNTVNNAVVGIFIGTETPISAVLDRLCASIGAYYLFDEAGVFKVGRLEAPGGAVNIELNEQIKEINRIQSQDSERGIPAYQINLTYKYNNTVQTADQLAGSVSDQRRAFLEKQSRRVCAQDTAVQTQWPQSKAITRETLLVNELDAQAEADRLLTLYKTLRRFYQIIMPAQAVSTPDLGQQANVIFSRFNLQAGQQITILSVARDTPAEGLTELEVWG